MKGIGLLLAFLMLVGCGQSEIEKNYDPAIYAALKDQPSDYADLALIAHQYNHLDSVLYYLEKHNYLCNRTHKDSPFPDESTVTVCQYSGFDFLPGRKTIYLLSRSHRLQKAVGKRKLPSWIDSPFWNKWLEARFSVPGINFPTIQHYADFVVDTLEISNYEGCTDGDLSLPLSERARCQDWLTERKQSWPKWSGQPIDIYTIETALFRLKAKGFDCPDFSPGNGSNYALKVPLTLEKEVAWLVCKNQSLSGQTQNVALGFKLEDSTFYRIRLELGTEKLDIPLLVVEPTANVTDRNVTVQAADGKVKRVGLMIEENRYWQKVAIPAVDFLSRQRLLNATAWQADIIQKSYEGVTSIPKQQQLDRIAFLFTRLGTDVLNEWRTTFKTLSPELLASIVIAECMQGTDEQAKQCFLPYLATNPQLAQIFTQSLAEIEPYVESLPDEHSVKKRINLFSSALNDYRQFFIPQQTLKKAAE